MKEKKQFLLDTDILVEHLIHAGSSGSALEKLMAEGLCFTTAINTSELFFAAESEEEKKAVLAMLRGLKVLGINSRYSLKISDFFNKVATTRDALLCVVASANDLPIATLNTHRYNGSGVEIINPFYERG